MKALTYGEAIWLVGDDTAAALIDYAVALGRMNSADSIELAAIDVYGRTEQVTFLIGPATMMTAEQSTSTLTEPENASAIATIRERIGRTRAPSPVPSPDRPHNDHIEDL